MNGIQVKNLVKTYTTQSTDIILNGAKRPSTTRTVLHGVSVDFPAGKLTAILGRSGCGKSTLLRLIDGTKDAPDSGEIVMPEGWRCALLSPDPYVITWTSVERNVAMAAGAGRTPEERLELAKKLVKLVRLEDYADMTPVELSTGMRQRLGLARVLASQAQVLLMDEPFASLDFITRGELQAELLDIQKELQKTILLVTHQLDEALLLAQRIVVLQADSSVRVWELEMPYKRDLTSPQLAALREETPAECRKDQRKTARPRSAKRASYEGKGVIRP